MPIPVDFEVKRDDLPSTRILSQPEGSELADGEVLFEIDHFALTANNITYALVGDQLDYWGFFSVGDGWGRIPAMGWSNVVASKHPEVEVGGRYFGWYPMSSHVKVAVEPSSTGLLDASPHRSQHAIIYRSFQDSRRDPFYDAEREERHALLRGLFITSFLADDFLADQGFFGSERTVVLSASSKTAIGFAAQSHGRGRNTVGVTSPGNVDFVKALELYDDVLTYDAIEALEPSVGTAVVDMAGNTEVLARVHRHLDGHVRYSMGIGLSHAGAGRSGTAASEGMPGPEQAMFFAPSQVEKRLRDWGPKVYGQRLGESLGAFVRGSERWLEIERADGTDAVGQTYLRLLAGRIPPSHGFIASLLSEA
ncbi:MAG: DUF2855 family protein [Acidobacteriota bacterium]